MKMLLILIISYLSCCYMVCATNLTVMTFNIWISGANVAHGVEKIVKHIKYINPDVVALQEVNNTQFLKRLVLMMGDDWYGVTTTSNYSDTAFLTRHKVIRDSISEVSHGVGARIEIENINRTIHFWSLHLDYRSYGPYAANNKLVTKYQQILAGEMANGQGRFQNMRELLMDEHFQQSVQKTDSEPLFVCGDFNAPSHLDWAPATSYMHGDWSFEWPATKMLQMEASMIDSFRSLHPNTLQNPGNTWSTVEKMSSTGWGYTIPEPQDRIDFIFYKSALVRPVQSYIYEGDQEVRPKPYHWNNDYPSDHFAVITHFAVY